MHQGATRTQNDRRLGLFVWGAATAIALIQAGCLEAGFRDLADSVLDPDAALLDRPGRRIASGTYSRLTIDGSLSEGGRVLAYRHDTKKSPSLAIIPFLEGESCEYSPAISFERVSSKVDIELDAVVAVQTTGEVGGLGTIRFIDFHCEEVMSPLKDAYMPRIAFPSKSPRGVLATTSEGELYLIDPVEKEKILVSPSVSQVMVNSSELWTVEEGQLVGRNEELELLEKLGDNVSEFMFGPGGKEEDSVFFLDDAGLFGWSKRNGVRPIAEDVCAPLMITPQVLAYFSPCEERRLMLEVPAQALGFPADDERVTIQGPSQTLTHLGPVTRFGFEGASSRILVLTSDDPGADEGTLVSLEIPKLPEQNKKGVVIPEGVELGEGFTFVGNDLFKRFSEGAGDLYAIHENEDGEIVEIALVAEHVAFLPGMSSGKQRGVLTDFDRETGLGTLARLSQSESDGTDLEVFTSNVPRQSIAADTETSDVAFVGEIDRDPSVGKAFLLRSGRAPKKIAEKSYVDTLRFLEQPRAVVYLSPSSAPTGTELHAYLIDAGLDLKIQDRVTEYRGLPWPAPGILYAVSEGDSAGIWFSKAR